MKHDHMSAWKPDEDRVILSMFATEGRKWGRIASVLPGRTSASVRNRYLRIEKGQQLRRAGLSKNRCAACGGQKIGHVCPMKLSLVYAEQVRHEQLRAQHGPPGSSPPAGAIALAEPLGESREPRTEESMEYELPQPQPRSQPPPTPPTPTLTPPPSEPQPLALPDPRSLVHELMESHSVLQERQQLQQQLDATGEHGMPTALLLAAAEHRQRLGLATFEQRPPRAPSSPASRPTACAMKAEMLSPHLSTEAQVLLQSVTAQALVITQGNSEPKVKPAFCFPLKKRASMPDSCRISA